MQALPTGGAVGIGAATLTQSDTDLTINQTSQKVSLNWQSFGIGSKESVTFVQPNASAIALNRVLGSDPSTIYGKLNANGQVYLINPNGILFGKAAEVNVGGLVASTLSLSDAEFIAGKRSFVASAGGSGGNVNIGGISNLGSIKADGGYIAFLGGRISNQGTLQANLGMVALAAGQQVTLDFAGDKLLSVQIDQGVVNSLVENRQAIQADGGTIILTAKAAGQVLSGVVNNGGVIRAQTLQNSAGVISLLGDMRSGEVNVGGTLDASAPNGGNGGVIIASAAQINVNEVANWSAAKMLLDAQRDISINSDLDAMGRSGLTLQYGQGALAAGNAGNYTLGSGARVSLPADSTFSTKSGSDGSTVKYAVISSLGGVGDNGGKTLQGISGDLTANYVLGGDIDSTATASWNGNAGFAPLGNKANAFAGIFDGLGHTISGLTINRPSVDYVGLFGYVSGGGVRNLTLQAANINGGNVVGGVAGYSNYATIRNAHVDGNITGIGWVGGLVGYNNYGMIGNADVIGNVSGSGWVGGLVGANYGSVDGAYATANVVGSNLVGGLVGVNEGGRVANVYAMGSVKGRTRVGGLVGANDYGTIVNAYAADSVSGDPDVGGLLGWNYAGTISNGFWDVARSGQVSSAGGVGLSGLQMRDTANFSGFSFTSSPGASGWVIVDSDGSINNGGGATGATTPMLASEYSSRISNAHQLQLMALAPTAHYVLDGNIDASATANGKDVWGASGFGPVGNASSAFTGSLDGRGHAITGLTINVPSVSGVGLFGVVGNGGAVQLLALSGGDVVGGNGVGALAGVNDGVISNVYATGNVSGASGVGGLVGVNHGSISQAYATGKVAGNDNTGGLVGLNAGQLGDAYAIGRVLSDAGSAGGLLGSNTATGVVNNGFWDVTTSGRITSAGGSGLGSAQMQTRSSFGQSLDFQSAWVIYDGLTYPLLRAFMTPLTVAANGVTKTYDGQAYSANTATYSTTPNSLLLGALSFSGSAIGATDAGSYGITPGGVYSTQQQGGYAIDFVSATLMVKPAVVTVQGTVAANKVYRGNTRAKMNSSIGGIVTGDQVSFAQIGNFEDANAGTDKLVTYINVLDGKDAHNYVLSSTGGTVKADISPKPVTVGGIASVESKVYDGTTAATLHGGKLSGVMPGDAVALLQTGVFATKNVGSGIAVKVADKLTGASAGNYTLIQPEGDGGLKGDISPRNVTAKGGQALSKVYDGGTAATVTGGSLDGVVAGDSVALAQSGVFATKNVGTGIAVSIAKSLIGSDAGNYVLNDTDGTLSNLSANITSRQLTVGGTVRAADKIYDGTLIASVSGGSVVGAMSGDKLSLIQTGSFADKAVGKGKTVTYTNRLDGADAGNYTLGSLGGTAANKASITARPVSVSGTTALDKVYDGTLEVTLRGTVVTGLVDGDLVGFEQSGRFSTATVGTGKLVIYTNSLSGADAANYSLSSKRGTTTAKIVKD